MAGDYARLALRRRMMGGFHGASAWEWAGRINTAMLDPKTVACRSVCHWADRPATAVAPSLPGDRSPRIRPLLWTAAGCPRYFPHAVPSCHDR